jgi:hypothetical protein
MAKFKILPTTNVDGYFTAKLADTAVTDNDVGKPVKLDVSTTDTYTLCADGDQIDAFIITIDPATADGLPLVTLNKGGYVRCESDGTMTIGDLVEAGAVAAAGTAEANKLPMVSTHAVVAVGDVFSSNWRVVSANTADGSVADADTTVIIAKC